MANFYDLLRIFTIFYQRMAFDNSQLVTPLVNRALPVSELLWIWSARFWIREA